MGAKGANHPNFGISPGAVRQTHMGWDLYAAGPKSGVGEIRCRKRLSRLPDNIASDTELAGRLPDQVIYPMRDHEAAKKLLTAMMELDLEYIHDQIKIYSGHHFYLDDFIAWAAHRLRTQGRAVTSALERIGPSRSAKQTTCDTLMQTVIAGIVTVKFNLIRFTNGDGWIKAEFSHKGHLLTDAWVDPVTGNYEVIECFKGRWRSINRPSILAEEYLEAVGEIGSLPVP